MVVVEVRLLDRDLYAGDPYPAYAWLRRHAPVYRDPATGLWSLARYQDVVWAETHPALLSSARGSRPRTGPQPSMIDSDDPWHNRQRRLVYRGFTPRQVAAWEPHVRKLATELLDAVAPRGSCDLVRDLAAPLPMAVIAQMLGVRPEDRDTLQHWSDVMISGADGPENVTPGVLQAAADFAEYCGRVIEERRREPAADLISTLVHAEVDGERLSEEELIGNALLILVGGNETTRHVISGGMLALMEHPDQRDKLLRDPAKIPAAVEECLRWVTPIVNMARTATEDVEVRGHTIPAGDQVLLLYASANRDEEAFPDPDRFEVERHPNHHLAFGVGTHFCLGASLARLEVRVMLEELLRRLPDMRVVPGAELRYTHSSFIRGLVSLPVEFTPERG